VCNSRSKRPRNGGCDLAAHGVRRLVRAEDGWHRCDRSVPLLLRLAARICDEATECLEVALRVCFDEVIVSRARKDVRLVSEVLRTALIQAVCVRAVDGSVGSAVHEQHGALDVSNPLAVGEGVAESIDACWRAAAGHRAAATVGRDQHPKPRKKRRVKYYRRNFRARRKPERRR